MISLPHSITRLTDDDIKDINKLYNHWDETKHEVWVAEAISEKTSEYIEHYWKEFEPIIQNHDVGPKAAEIWIRSQVEQWQTHESEWVNERLRDYVPRTFAEMLDCLIWLEQCETHKSEFIDNSLAFYKNRGWDIPSAHDECQERLILEECEKFRSEYIDREIQRLKDEYLLRNPKEEFKNRMNLQYFENEVKDKDKIANKDAFWDMVSIHGLENNQLLKEELNNNISNYAINNECIIYYPWG